jgi:hypothetical protein
VYGARFVSLVHIRKSLERNVFIILLIAKAEKNNQMEMKKNISNPKSKECICSQPNVLPFFKVWKIFGLQRSKLKKNTLNIHHHKINF